MSRVGVRYIVDDVPIALQQDASPAFVAVVRDGVPFRTQDVVSGPGGAQAILDDPSGNPVELFQPRSTAGAR